MRLLLPIISILLFCACSPTGSSFSFDDNDPPTQGTWLIPSDEIFDGGPGKDGIPSIDDPQFISVAEVDFLEDDDLVIAIAYGETVKVYPHSILDWHEIVNDRIDDFSFALTYCPLTGTAINWNRRINGAETTFGVSGLLYNSNLIPYDRATDSNWSQIRLDCVNGENSGMRIETFPIFEGRWEDIQEIENIQVLSTETGFARDYGRYPYGDYRTNHSNIIFPISNRDDRLQNKERTLGLLGGMQPKVYSFSNFTVESEQLLVDTYEGKELMIIASKVKNYMVAFYPHEGRTYTSINDEFPYILMDDRGEVYDIFGRSKSNASDRLEQPEQFMGYWFSWPAFYPDLVLFQN